VEITFMGWGGVEEDEGVRAAIEQFQEETPGIEVTWLHTPENYVEKLLASIAALTPPDTAFINDYIFQEFARDGILLDVTGMLRADPLLGAEDYFTQPQEAERSTRDGKWYGIGSCWVGPHVYYNADIFDAEGIEPPSNDPDEAWDWDYFIEIAQQLTVDANGNHPGDSGFDIDNVERWGVHMPTWWWPPLAFVFANGGTVVDPEGIPRLLLDQPEAAEAIQRIADLMLVDQVMPQSAIVEALGMSNTQMLENGRLAMAVDGSWALAWMYKIEATLGTACLPKMKQPATVLGCHMHGALSGSAHPEAAWKWLRFLASPYYETYFNRIGLWLPNQSWLLTEEGLGTWLDEEIHPAGFEALATEFFPGNGRFVPMPPGMQKVTNIIDTAYQAVWVGDRTAEEAMAQAVLDANEAFADGASQASGDMPYVAYGRESTDPCLHASVATKDVRARYL
jgi:multiple sugar transport system substrate-binding protein